VAAAPNRVFLLTRQFVLMTISTFFAHLTTISPIYVKKVAKGDVKGKTISGGAFFDFLLLFVAAKKSQASNLFTLYMLSHI
jgi:hypothetical protein